MALQKSSPVYKWFIISQDSDHANCKLCHDSIKSRRSDNSLQTYSMMRHLHRKHPNKVNGSSLDISDNTVGIPRKLSTENMSIFFSPPQHEIIPDQSEKSE